MEFFDFLKKYNLKPFMMPNTPMNPNWPQGGNQDNIIGRMKQTGAYGAADSFGRPTAALGGSVLSNNDATINVSGTVQNQLYTLNQLLIPQNAFIQVGRSLTVTFWGTTAANANAKNFQINFGSIAVLTVTGSVVNGGPYYGELNVIRYAPSTWSAVGWLQIATATNGALNIVQPLTGPLETADILVNIQSSNTAAAAASATGQGAIGTWSN